MNVALIRDLEMPLVLRAQTAEELMVPNPISLRAEAGVAEAIKLFTEKGIAAAPVIDEAGRPIGVISRSDLPSATPAFFFVGEPNRFHLCVRRERWKQLKGQPGARKLVNEHVAVIDEENCERNPNLPTRDELEEFHRRYGFKRR